MLTGVALTTGKDVKAELTQMIEEQMILEGLRVVKEEEVGVAIWEVVEVGEMAMKEEEAGEEKKAKVGV